MTAVFNAQLNEGSVTTVSYGRLSFDWLLLLPPAVALALFVAGNANFGFASPGFLDAFVYVGYFWHYPEHLAIFDSYYKISRLPWILPGFVAHSLLDEIAASYLLHWTTLSAGGVALYLLLRDTLKDHLIAVLLAVGWVCSTRGHGLGGWNYHMMAASAYFLLANWLLVRTATQTSRRSSAVLGGAALACAIHTHLTYILFVPLAVLLYFVAIPRWSDRWTPVAIDAGLVAVGGLGLTLLLGAVNAATGGAWLFFLGQVQWALYTAQPGNDVWWVEASRWLPNATYLVLPIASLCAGTAALLRRGDERGRFLTAFVFMGWVAVVVLAYYQFVERRSVLDHDQISYGLYCYAFLALAVVMLRAPAHSSGGRKDMAVAFGAVAIMLGSLLFGMPTVLPSLLRQVSASLASNLPPALPPLVVGLAGLMAAAALPRRLAVLVTIVSFSAINIWAAPWPGQYGIGTPGIQREMLSLFREVDRFTTPLDPSLDRIEYWFTTEAIETSQGSVNLAHVFDSYISTRAWLGNLFALKSPGLPIEEIDAEHVRDVTCLGVLSSTPAHEVLRAQMLSRFDRLGHPLKEVASRRFQGSELAFALTVFRLTTEGGGRPSPPPPSGSPACDS